MAQRIINKYDANGTPVLPTMKHRYRRAVKEKLRSDIVSGFMSLVDMSSMIGPTEDAEGNPTGKMSSSAAQNAEDSVSEAIETFADVITDSVFDFCEQYMLAHFMGHVDIWHRGLHPDAGLVDTVHSTNYDTFKPKGQQIQDSGLDYGD